ncbi:hypothetical protein BH10BDE1_BH10BDE1_16000 [soil metagenome]
MRGLKTMFLILAMLFAPDAVFAYSPKEGNVSATLGWLLHRTNFQNSGTGASAPFQGDFALIVNGDITDRGQLEIGMYHLNKQYFRDQGSVYVGEETELIEITLGYRQWFTPSLSLGVSFSSAYSMGYPRIIHNDFAPSPPIDTSATDTTEYGFHFSLQSDVYTRDRLTLTLTGLYSLSVTGKPNEKADHYGAMIGLRYFIQEKMVVPKPKDAI